jgi:hypothetical protein
MALAKANQFKSVSRHDLRTARHFRPPLPAQEGLDRSAVFFICRRAMELKCVDDERGLIVLLRPEIEQSPAKNQSVSGSD